MAEEHPGLHQDSGQKLVEHQGQGSERSLRIEGEGTDLESRPHFLATVAVVVGNIGTKSTGDALVRIAADTVERFGGVDLLVNNAGTFASKPFIDVTEEELDGYLNGNLKGTYLTT